MAARASLYQRIRVFFAERNVLEVEVPLLHSCTHTAVHLQSFTVSPEGWYLQTSPEFFMKRLLAAGSGDIFTLCKAFRRCELGAHHNPEFSILEWYRCGYDEHQLMREVGELLALILSLHKVYYLSYQQLFEQSLGINPHHQTLKQLNMLIERQTSLQQSLPSIADALDWLQTYCVTTFFKQHKTPELLLFVYDFPTVRAELAQLGKNTKGQHIARRFEGYYDGYELCNGYFELNDSEQQWQRMHNDNKERQKVGLEQIAIDSEFVQILDELPSCSGVALGLDRLLQLQLKLSNIHQTLTFSHAPV